MQRITLTQKTILKPVQVIKLIQCLTLPEKEFIKKLNEIESDKIYETLTSLKIIKRAYHTKTNSIRSFYQLKEEILISRNSSTQLYPLITENYQTVELIRSIGEENFRKFFLSAEIFQIKEIAEELNLKEEDIKKIIDFVNDMLIYDEIDRGQNFLLTSRHVTQPQTNFLRLAKIDFESDNSPVIIYLIPYFIRGKYIVDYQAVEDFIRTHPKEKHAVRNLLQKINFVNMKTQTVHNILETLTAFQKNFLISNQQNKLEIILQKDIAKMLNIHPAVVSRAIKQKSIITPYGVEIPLEALFVNKKEFVMTHLMDFLADEKYTTLTHSKLLEVIKKKFNIKLSRRSLSNYLQILKTTN